MIQALTHSPSNPRAGQAVIFTVVPNGGDGLYNYSWYSVTGDSLVHDPLTSDTNRCMVTFRSAGEWTITAHIISNAQWVEQSVKVKIRP